MFEPNDAPRVFGLPPGVDFPRALVEGLIQRNAGKPPEALARVRIFVNTRRMARRIRDLFDQGPPVLLPRIRLVTEFGDSFGETAVPYAAPPLRRRLELMQLVSRLLDHQPDLAPRNAIFDLADSLADLVSEMNGEGVSPAVIEGLDVDDQSGHWARIKSFLGIVRDYIDNSADPPDAEARQRLLLERLTLRWQSSPPAHAIIIAGSTGSRGTTRLIMRTVARLAQGAVILPGFDFDMPSDVWPKLRDGMRSEDHPQFRLYRFIRETEIAPTDVRPWCQTAPPSAARNRIVSLALRPAPVTDQWLRDGPELGDIPEAMANVTLLEAQSSRQEALAIAMRLRMAVEEGKVAALITPDRVLTRQVTAALDRWNIVPDDSAGQPLHLTPPGRLLRYTAELFSRTLSAESLLTLLKHPLSHGGHHRVEHLELTRAIEIHLRKNGPPYPTARDFHNWAETRSGDFEKVWVDWLCHCFAQKVVSGTESLESWIGIHIALTERIAQGCLDDGTGDLWQNDAGEAARKVIDEILAEASHGGEMSAPDYAALFESILATQEVRSAVEPHPDVLIWGTLEARVQGPELLILGALNEGTWPDVPYPDPWLNRALRHRAGLLLPESRIGLAAHDFQQAVGAQEVWLTRSLRNEGADAVISRWLNRLQNLLAGLPDQGGAKALADMRARGAIWLDRARRLESPDPVAPAKRPAPCPPRDARPDRLSVTEIKRLIRDPYSVYARHVLALRPLDPLMRVPDVMSRGTALHGILEAFIRGIITNEGAPTRDDLIMKSVTFLAETIPWADAQILWLARLERAADAFIAGEMKRRARGTPVALEVSGHIVLEDLGFTLTAKADRIDVGHDGRLHIYDYKTSKPPSAREQAAFDKQLLLEAAIAERAGFGDLGPMEVAGAAFIAIGGNPEEVPAPIDNEPPEKLWAEFARLITSYLDPETGYVSRRAMQKREARGDFDQLARYGEWDVTDAPYPTKVGQ